MKDLFNRSSKAYGLLSLTAGVFFSAVLFLMEFMQRRLSFAYSQPYLLADNLVVTLIVLALLTGLAFLRHRFRRQRSFSRWGLFLAGYLGALVVVQFFFTRSVWYHPGFDVVNVYTNAQLIAQGQPFDGEYFRLCPNNAPITVMLVAPLWIATRLGLAVPYAILPYLGALMANGALLLSALCVAKLTRSRFARLGALLLGTAWIAFSMLTTVPYTDIFAIPFPVLALYLYLSRLSSGKKWFLISLVVSLGASIKPTVSIFLIALIALSALRACMAGQWTGRSLRRIAAIGLLIVLGALPGTLWKNLSTAYLAGSAHPQEQLSETHYLMLGMNPDTYGGHTMDDVNFSASFPGLAQRRTANLQRAWERLANRGIGGNVGFFAVKAYKAFGDGLLASDKSFLVLEVPVRQDALSNFLRSLFHSNGRLHPLWATFQQGVWLCVLLMSLFALWNPQTRKRKITGLLGLTLLGLALYLLLFEVWPRYVYLFAPFFVILASIGLERLRIAPAMRKMRPRRRSAAKEGA